MIRYGMWYVFSFLDPFNQDKIGIYFSISLYFLWITWNSMIRSLCRVILNMDTRFRTWYGQVCTWGALFQMLFFRSYWYWCHWQKTDPMSMSSPWLPFFDSYDALEKNLNHLKIIKLNFFMGGNVTDFCIAVLVDS